MSRHGRANRGMAYDARTGFKVRASRLREDGEMPGIYTTDPDDRHPLRFRRPLAPEGSRANRPGHSPQHAIPAEVNLALLWDTSGTMRPTTAPQLKLDDGGLQRLAFSVYTGVDWDDGEDLLWDDSELMAWDI